MEQNQKLKDLVAKIQSARKKAFVSVDWMGNNYFAATGSAITYFFDQAGVYCNIAYDYLKYSGEMVEEVREISGAF